jgi:hypothetical protein
VVELLGGIGPIGVLLLFYLWLSFLPFTLAPHYQGPTRSSLPPAGILRLAGNPGHTRTRSQNKFTLSFQSHTGVPSLQPDVAMLCCE